jgi:hypothetical protein
MPKIDEIQRALERVVEAHLGPGNVERLELSPVEDLDGHEVLRVDVYHRFKERAIDARKTYRLSSALREAASALGETRDLWPRYHFDERQRVEA